MKELAKGSHRSGERRRGGTTLECWRTTPWKQRKTKNNARQVCVFEVAEERRRRTREKSIKSKPKG